MTPAALANLFVSANHIEAGLWILIGLAFLLAAARTGPRRTTCLAAAVAFSLFGLSDLIEARTGAWWRPWWLLLWKAGCIAALLWLGWSHWRQRPPQQPHHLAHCRRTRSVRTSRRHGEYTGEAVTIK